jgi:uncharacterized membrane protein
MKKIALAVVLGIMLSMGTVHAMTQEMWGKIVGGVVIGAVGAVIGGAAA